MRLKPTCLRYIRSGTHGRWRSVAFSSAAHTHPLTPLLQSHYTPANCIGNSVYVMESNLSDCAETLGLHHRRAVAQPCVNGDRLSQWGMAKFDPSQIRDHSTDWRKIWNKWLGRRDDSQCKISCKSVHLGLLGKWVKYKFFLIP